MGKKTQTLKAPINGELKYDVKQHIKEVIAENRRLRDLNYNLAQKLREARAFIQGLYGDGWVRDSGKDDFTPF